MPDDYATLLAQAEKTGEGRVKISHLATQFEYLNNLYDAEDTRERALLLAKDWAECNDPLRKAATGEWAKERKIQVGDKPDPNATVPKPNDLSDGIDAPDSGPKAAGAGAAENKAQNNPSDNDGKSHPGTKAAPKKGVNTIDKLRMMKTRRMAPAAHAGTNATAAAYEAGVRDANTKHANAAHRIGSLTARHAFQMGAEAGHRMASNAHAAAGAGRLAVPHQQVMSHPGTTAPALMDKGDLAGTLAKVYDETKHGRDNTGKFTAKRTSPSYLRAFGRGVAEAVPGAVVSGFGTYRGSRAIRIAGAIGAAAGTLHGRYASFKNQAKQAGVKNPGQSATRLTAASTADHILGPFGGALAVHATGFGKRAPVSDRITTLAKLGA